MNKLICKLIGHKSFKDSGGDIAKEYDFCRRCLKGIGILNDKSPPGTKEGLR